MNASQSAASGSIWRLSHARFIGLANNPSGGLTNVWMEVKSKKNQPKAKEEK